jgi:hypothetical protein
MPMMKNPGLFTIFGSTFPPEKDRRSKDKPKVRDRDAQVTSETYFCESMIEMGTYGDDEVDT